MPLGHTIFSGHVWRYRAHYHPKKTYSRMPRKIKTSSYREEPGPATKMGLRPKRARADGQLPPLSQPPLYIIVRS